MKRILLTVIAAIVLTACAFSQNIAPTFNQATNKFSWAISVDTTQQMYGCSTNNYNAEGQCTGSSQWYLHTGEVLLSVTNTRTGITVGSSQTVQGGVATASVTIDAQPGDVLNYTETNRVWCPSAGVWVGMYNLLGHIEIAYTLTAYTGGPRGQCTQVGTALWCAYPVQDWCSASTTPPDDSYNGRTINDTAVHAYWGTVALCFRPGSSGPWSCSNGGAVGLDGAHAFGACTKHP